MTKQKSKHQAATDFLNKIAFSWADVLKDHWPGRYTVEMDRIAEALSDLNLDRLTIKQKRAVAHLIGAVARAAFSGGVELGKSFNKGGKK